MNTADEKALEDSEKVLNGLCGSLSDSPVGRHNSHCVKTVRFLGALFFFLTENEHNKLGKLAGMTNGFSWIGSYPNSHKKFLKDFLKNTYAMERVFCKKILGIGLFFLLNRIQVNLL